MPTNRRKPSGAPESDSIAPPGCPSDPAWPDLPPEINPLTLRLAVFAFDCCCLVATRTSAVAVACAPFTGTRFAFWLNRRALDLLTLATCCLDDPELAATALICCGLLLACLVLAVVRVL